MHIKQCRLCNGWSYWQDNTTVGFFPHATQHSHIDPFTLPFFREFATSTVLTIAHRLRTVIDYDRVSYLRIYTGLLNWRAPSICVCIAKTHRSCLWNKGAYWNSIVLLYCYLILPQSSTRSVKLAERNNLPRWDVWQASEPGLQLFTNEDWLVCDDQ